MHDDEAAAPETVPSEARRRPRRIPRGALADPRPPWSRPATGSRPTASGPRGAVVAVTHSGIAREGRARRLRSDRHGHHARRPGDPPPLRRTTCSGRRSSRNARASTCSGSPSCTSDCRCASSHSKAPSSRSTKHPTWYRVSRRLGAPAKPKTLPDGWTVQVDRVALHDSILKLRCTRHRERTAGDLHS